MRIYICADIEGIAGIVSRGQLGPPEFEYDWARKIMTAEVNAAIRGAKAAGAREIVVSDSHGNGQNILLDELETGASLIRSWPRPLSMMAGIDQGSFAAALFVGHHAGVANPRGCLSHTMSSRVLTSLKVNGQPASETLINSAIAGHFDVPVVLVTGDDVYVDEARTVLPGVPAVVTKWSLGTLSARCRPPADVQDEIAIAARDAVADATNRATFKMSTPIDVEMEMKSRLSVEMLEYLPFTERLGAHTIGFEARDIVEASHLLTFILGYEPNLQA